MPTQRTSSPNLPRPVTEKHVSEKHLNERLVSEKHTTEKHGIEKHAIEKRPIEKHSFEKSVNEKSSGEKSSRRPGKSSPERIYNLLMKARTANEVTLHFESNRVVSGALIFNEFKGTGRIINVDLEISVDFSVEDLRDVRL